MRTKDKNVTKLSPEQRIKKLIKILSNDGYDCTVFLQKKERPLEEKHTYIQDPVGNVSICSNLPDLPHIGIMLADVFNINQSTRLLSQLISSQVKSDYLLSSLVLSDKSNGQN